MNCNRKLLSYNTLVVVVTVWLAMTRAALGQTWDGGAGTGNWGTANNWNPNSLPGTVLVTFDAANANSQYTISLGRTRTVAGIRFLSAAGSDFFTFNNSAANRLEVGTLGIANLDDDVQIFNTQIRLVNGNQTWSSVAGGGLTFNNTVDLRGRILTLALSLIHI